MTAIVVGATGATGKQLVAQLLENPNVATVKIFIRKKITLSHPKLEIYVVNFDVIDTWQHLLAGNVLFSVLGTTLKQAGSKVNQYKVDVTYQYNITKAALGNGISTIVLLSAFGANPSSIFFYPKMKGVLEALLKNLPLVSLHIFQPGILERFANDERLLEKLSVKLLQWLNGFDILLSQAPIPVALLAAKMIKVGIRDNVEKLRYYRLNAILEV